MEFHQHHRGAGHGSLEESAGLVFVAQAADDIDAHRRQLRVKAVRNRRYREHAGVGDRQE
jgi:hypothetical protein